MAKFAVTLSNDKIIYVTAANDIVARRRVEEVITKHKLIWTIKNLRKISGR